MAENVEQNNEIQTGTEPIDLTKDGNESDNDLEKRITRRKGKPKKFENLSEIDIDEKRKVANIQERKRMKKLSKALEDLRKCIPAEYHISNRKMSKIRTLRLAVNYIASLTEIIERDNVLKQQTYHLENQMLQSTFSYIMPSPMAVQQFIQQGSLPRHQTTEFSPYHTPEATCGHRLTKRHLNFSPFSGIPSPSMIPKGTSFPSRVKTEMTPFKTPEMISRRRTSTIASPFVSDIRNINELSTSFVSPSSEDSDLTGPEHSRFNKPYSYTLEGISPLQEEDNFSGGTDCVYDPRRRQTRTSLKE